MDGDNDGVCDSNSVVDICVDDAGSLTAGNINVGSGIDDAFTVDSDDDAVCDVLDPCPAHLLRDADGDGICG